ncbi:MAG: hypothetical protein A3J59_04130 [Candidatus Buchananbacteria bacterium RIFCSPHIGHO2_02_FULL_56_16]|uniref:Uncharacterized protein n=1 Tax=Candidatus Buchananbacteria bacterium RIFCSPHIGHO2_02_FULL_56_16 TaxID=1797542 RepID=A0A1G1YJT9_9BACT|nr:MAG: hypothetical protein A3J59_04130 [Candidatus Buchananbacteria bacterium RIFCSPHIGHO2_02_FULL_56_16]
MDEIDSKDLKEINRTMKSFPRLLKKYRQMETAFRDLQGENRRIKAELSKLRADHQRTRAELRDLRHELRAHREGHEQLKAKFQANQVQKEAETAYLENELEASYRIINQMIAEHDVTLSNREAAIDRSIQLGLKPPLGLRISGRNRLIGLFDRNRLTRGNADDDIDREVREILRNAPRDEP